MDYFILDAVTGELRTARPLDKEAVDNSEGILTLNIKVKFIALLLCYYLQTFYTFRSISDNIDQNKNTFRNITQFF